MKNFSFSCVTMAACLREKYLSMALFPRAIGSSTVLNFHRGTVISFSRGNFTSQNPFSITYTMRSLSYSKLTPQRLAKKNNEDPQKSIESTTAQASDPDNTVPGATNSSLSPSASTSFSTSTTLSHPSSSHSPFPAVSTPASSQDSGLDVAALHRLLADEKALLPTLSSLSPTTRDTLIRHLFDIVHHEHALSGHFPEASSEQSSLSSPTSSTGSVTSLAPSIAATVADDFASSASHSSQQSHPLPSYQSSSLDSGLPHADITGKERESMHASSIGILSKTLTPSKESNLEPAHPSHHPSIADAVFNTLDINQDGQVSPREFRIWYNLHFKSSQGAAEHSSASSNVDTPTASTHRSTPVPLSTIDVTRLSKEMPLTSAVQLFPSSIQSRSDFPVDPSGFLPSQESLSSTKETAASAKIIYSANMDAYDTPALPTVSPISEKGDIFSQTPVEGTTLSEGASPDAFRSTQGVQNEANDRHPFPITITRYQTYIVLLRSSIPYIGFGIMDNCLMLLCGEMIDFYMGAFLGLSTLAAAGLGNMISCASGVLTGGFIERLVYRLGLPSAKLTPLQADSRVVKNAHLSGSMLGICIGCLIGMFPLLLLKNGSKEKEAPSENTQVVKPLEE